MLPEIAIGAIIAAIIAAMISLAGLVIAKESKVSEFRQNWIDSLRSELSSFTSHLNALSDINVIEFDNEKERFECSKDSVVKLNEAYYSVALRLNVIEESSALVRNSMVKLSQSVKQPLAFSKADFDEAQIEFISVSNSLLKHEWSRVKAGEAAYRWTLRLAGTILIGFISSMAIIMIANFVAYKKVALISAASKPAVVASKSITEAPSTKLRTKPSASVRPPVAAPDHPSPSRTPSPRRAVTSISPVE